MVLQERCPGQGGVDVRRVPLEQGDSQAALAEPALHEADGEEDPG